MYWTLTSISTCIEPIHKTVASLCSKINFTGEVVLQHENARVLKEPLASTRLGPGSPGCSLSRQKYVLNVLFRWTFSWFWSSCWGPCPVPSNSIALHPRPCESRAFKHEHSISGSRMNSYEHALIQHCTGPIPDNNGNLVWSEFRCPSRIHQHIGITVPSAAQETQNCRQDVQNLRSLLRSRKTVAREKSFAGHVVDPDAERSSFQTWDSWGGGGTWELHWGMDHLYSFGQLSHNCQVEFAFF